MVCQVFTSKLVDTTVFVWNNALFSLPLSVSGSASADHPVQYISKPTMVIHVIAGFSACFNVHCWAGIDEPLQPSFPFRVWAVPIRATYKCAQNLAVLRNGHVRLNCGSHYFQSITGMLKSRKCQRLGFFFLLLQTSLKPPRKESLRFPLVYSFQPFSHCPSPLLTSHFLIPQAPTQNLNHGFGFFSTPTSRNFPVG